MTTKSETLWTVLVDNIPLAKWIDINDLYKIVEKNFNSFTDDDLSPVTKGRTDSTWRRNLRNVLQRKKKIGEILYNGNSKYKIDKPYVWRMIKEAVNNLDGEIQYSEIRNFILNKWDDVNVKTINAQITVLSVNHYSRTHYPENQKPRLTNQNSVYDFLYNLKRGVVEKYDKAKHNIWEIYRDRPNKYLIRVFKETLEPKIYSPTDIKWFKNVTNETLGEAYLNLSTNIFYLHFPTKHKTNILTPAVGDLILLYQKVDGIKAFTHLVTPIDNNLIENNKSEDYKYARLVRIISKKTKEDFIPLSKTLFNKIKISGITQGNVCNLNNIKGIQNIENLQLDIWLQFQNSFINQEQQSVIVTNSILNEIEFNNNINFSALEGGLKLISHYIRERNRKLIDEKKKNAIRNEKLFCEVCSFSFIEKFEIEFIECHHITPISESGEVKTTLDHLALVCSNCHRMLHKKFNNKYLSINELKQKIK